MSNRRQQRIREEVGLPANPQPVPVFAGRQWLGFAGASVGALAWMFGLASQSHDTPAMLVVAVAMAVLVIVCRRFVPGRSVPQLRRCAIIHALLIGAFTLAMVNWRLYQWIAATADVPLAKAHERIPLWTVNLFTVVLTVVVLLTVLASFPGRRADQRLA